MGLGFRLSVPECHKDVQMQGASAAQSGTSSAPTFKGLNRKHLPHMRTMDGERWQGVLRRGRHHAPCMHATLGSSAEHDSLRTHRHQAGMLALTGHLVSKP